MVTLSILSELVVLTQSVPNPVLLFVDALINITAVGFLVALVHGASMLGHRDNRVIIKLIIKEGRCRYTVSSIYSLIHTVGSKIMTVLATFAYGFIVFGPIGALFCTTVAPHPYEIIISIAG